MERRYEELINLIKTLAVDEKKERKKTFSRLRAFLEETPTEFWEDNDNLLKLWKGIYYALWMADKAVLQRKISKQFVALANSKGKKQFRLVYLSTGLETLSREWQGIDPRRIDKYYFLLTEIYHALVEVAMERGFDMEGLVKKMLDGIAKTGMYAKAMNYHFYDKYLNIMKECLEKPIIREKIVKENEIALYPYFAGFYAQDKVLFKRVMLSFKEFIEELENRDESALSDTFSPKSISDGLMECSSDRELPQRNRAILYEMRERVKLLDENLERSEETGEAQKKRKIDG